MSPAAKWKNRASKDTCGGEVVSSIFSISSKYPLKPNSEDCGNIEHKIPTPGLGTAGAEFANYHFLRHYLRKASADMKALSKRMALK